MGLQHAKTQLLLSGLHISNLTFAGASTCDEGLVVCSCGTPRTQAGFGGCDEGTSKLRMNRKSVRTFRRLERLYLQKFSVILDFRVPMYVETQDRSIPFQVFACEPDRMVPQASLFRPDRTESRQTRRCGYFSIRLQTR